MAASALLPIDLRSDTVTLPTEAMRGAMRLAALGDDGLDGDPTVRELEEKAANRLGKEAGLFVTSGTMGNLVASLVYAEKAGGVALVDQGAHILRSEGGGITRLAGLRCEALPTTDGEMDLNAVAGALKKSTSGQVIAMAVVETTHNFSGGTVPSLAYLEALGSLALGAGVPVHIDGARLFNAAVNLDVDASVIARHGDSVTFCLSKGLSAPMGSVLVGSRDFIARARPYRKMVGGGLRQAGVVAAAGIVALERMVPRLQEDHVHARALWRQVGGALPGLVSETPPASNIVMLGLRDGVPAMDARQTVAALASKGLLVRARDDRVLRLVTHRHIDEKAATDAAAILAACLTRA